MRLAVLLLIVPLALLALPVRAEPSYYRTGLNFTVHAFYFLGAKSLTEPQSGPEPGPTLVTVRGSEVEFMYGTLGANSLTEAQSGSILIEVEGPEIEFMYVTAYPTADVVEWINSTIYLNGELVHTFYVAYFPSYLWNVTYLKRATPFAPAGKNVIRVDYTISAPVGVNIEVTICARVPGELVFGSDGRPRLYVYHDTALYKVHLIGAEAIYAFVALPTAYYDDVINVLDSLKNYLENRWGQLNNFDIVPPTPDSPGFWIRMSFSSPEGHELFLDLNEYGYTCWFDSAWWRGTGSATFGAVLNFSLPRYTIYGFTNQTYDDGCILEERGHKMAYFITFDEELMRMFNLSLGNFTFTVSDGYDTYTLPLSLLKVGAPFSINPIGDDAGAIRRVLIACLLSEPGIIGTAAVLVVRDGAPWTGLYLFANFKRYSIYADVSLSLDTLLAILIRVPPLKPLELRAHASLPEGVSIVQRGASLFLRFERFGYERRVARVEPTGAVVTLYGYSVEEGDAYTVTVSIPVTSVPLLGGWAYLFNDGLKVVSENATAAVLKVERAGSLLIALPRPFVIDGGTLYTSNGTHYFVLIEEAVPRTYTIVLEQEEEPPSEQPLPKQLPALKDDLLVLKYLLILLILGVVAIFALRKALKHAVTGTSTRFVRRRY